MNGTLASRKRGIPLRVLIYKHNFMPDFSETGACH